MSLKESYQPMDVPPEAPPWREWSGNLTGGLEKGLQGCGVDRSEFYPQIGLRGLRIPAAGMK